MTATAFTPDQIAQAKAAYENAVSAQATASKNLADLKASHEPITKAYEQAKAALDGLKPSLTVAKAQLQMADGAVTMARTSYQMMAPKEVAAENKAKKGASNKELLAAVQTFLADKPDGASINDIYNGIVAAGVVMAGADPRTNLTNYLSRWGSAGSLVDKGRGQWGVGNVPASTTPAPSFLGESPAAPVEQPPVPGFAAPVEQAPTSDVLDDNFPGIEVLRENGLTTRASLAGSTVDSLTKIPGIGTKRAEAILAALG